VGRVLEYPYSTPMGSLNMILATHHDTTESRPDACKIIVDVQRKASTYAMANPSAMVDMTVAKLGQKREAVEVSVPNVELNWRMTPEMMTQTRIYAQQMLELKQIRALPDFDVFLDPKFSDEVAKQA
jgi:NitT/TauT family transport system substrate-binding protein